MITSMITPMITPMVTSMFGDGGATTRYFTLLDSVLENYWEFASTLTLQVGDTFEFEYLAGTELSTERQYLTDGEDDSTRAWFIIETNGLFNFQYGTQMDIYVDDSQITSTDSAPLDGKLHKVRIEPLEEITIDYLGVRKDSTSFYDGILADPVSTISGSTQTFTLGNSYEQGDIEYSAENTFGSELVDNGDFTDYGGASHSIAGNEVTVNADGGTNNGVQQSFTTVVGEVYSITSDVNAVIGSGKVLVGNAVGSGGVKNVTVNSGYQHINTTFTATATTTFVSLQTGGGTSDQSKYTSTSIREIQGNAITRYLVPSTNIEQYTLTDGVWVGDDTFDPSSASAYGESTILSSNDYDIISSSGVNSGINFVDEFVVGEVYVVAGELYDSVSGSLSVGDTSGTAQFNIDSAGAFSGEVVATTAHMQIKRASGVTDLKVRNMSVKRKIEVA